MSRSGQEKHLKASIFDRLIDDNPEMLSEPEKDKYQQMLDMKKSVQRDLESLLNTRYRLLEPSNDHKELQKSLLNYGLPDLATINVTDLEKKKEFTKYLERTLKEFEPRFKSVKVNYIESNHPIDRTLRFRVNAIMYADPAPETVVFDSVLEPISRTVNVEETLNG